MASIGLHAPREQLRPGGRPAASPVLGVDGTAPPHVGRSRLRAADTSGDGVAPELAS